MANQTKENHIIIYYNFITPKMHNDTQIKHILFTQFLWTTTRKLSSWLIMVKDQENAVLKSLFKKIFEQTNILNCMLLLHEEHLQFKCLVTVYMHICFLRESSVLFVYWFVWLFSFSVAVCFSSLACLFACLFVCFVCFFFACLSVYLSVCFACLFVYLHVCMFICFFVSLFVLLFVC